MKLSGLMVTMLIIGAGMIVIWGTIGDLQEVHQVNLSSQSEHAANTTMLLLEGSQNLTGSMQQDLEEGRVGDTSEDTNFFRKAWSSVRQIPKYTNFASAALTAYSEILGIPVWAEVLIASLVIVILGFGIVLLFRIGGGIFN